MAVESTSNVNFPILISVANISLSTANMLSVIGKLYSPILLKKQSSFYFRKICNMEKDTRTILCL